MKRELEGGTKAVVKIQLPALLTCQLGLNTPRYPTLPNLMKAKRKELKTIDVADLLNAEELLSTDKMYVPAWEGLAAVHERLGCHEEAKRFEEEAERAAQALYHRQIEADIRGRHPLFRPLFGIRDNDF